MGNLFPFVFWVSLLISVLFRQYIWISSTQSLQKVRLIRVSDVIVSPDQVYLSKNIIVLQEIKVAPTENYRYKSETPADFLGRTVTAIGNPQTKSPGFNFADFTIGDAKIDISGAHPSRLIAAKISFFSLAVSLRASFARSLGSLYSGREAEIMAGILLGSRDGFPADFTRRLQQSGLMHLAAASGYNISIVAGVFGLAAARLTRINVIKVIIVIAFILFYIIISGGQASVVRAGLMGAVAFAASLAGSAASVRRLFAAAALLMLLVKPAWLWDLGFQLSVAATAGMIWLVPVFEFGPSSRASVASRGIQQSDLNRPAAAGLDSSTPLRSARNDSNYSTWHSLIGVIRICRKLLAWPPVAESFAASLATAPVLILNLGWQRLSLTSIPANVLATPLVAPLMAASAVVGALGLLARPVPVLAPLAAFAAILTRPLVAALILIIDLSAAANEKLMGNF